MATVGGYDDLMRGLRYPMQELPGGNLNPPDAAAEGAPENCRDCQSPTTILNHDRACAVD